MKLSYPCGAGGSWLSHLVDCLATNKHISHAQPHYHAFAHSSVYLCDSNHDNIAYHDADKNIMLAGMCIYDFYVNYFNKYQFIDFRLNQESYQSQIKIMIDYTCRYFKWVDYLKHTQPNLQYELLYTNQARFVDDLFAVMQKHSIPCNKDRMFVYYKIHEYKKTVFDPMQSFGNNDSILWLGWCIGYMMAHGLDCPNELLLESNKHVIIQKSEQLRIAEESRKFLLRP